jgi:hypothetical protein
MILRLGPALILLALASPAGADEAPRPFRCAETTSSDFLADVSPEGEFRLAGGGVARLADLRLAPAGQAARAAGLWLRSLGQTQVRLRELAPPDRWGRAAVILEIPGGAVPIDVGELLVSEGLAIVDPGQRDMLCRRELLAAENRARENRLGLWREGTWPIPAAALADLERAAGSFAIVEGRVLSVGERRERTYLNFGRDWSRDFNVTIPRRSWADLKARGVTAETLKGRLVRVRGMVEARRTPTLDLVVPDMLELVEARASRSGDRWP